MLDSGVHVSSLNVDLSTGSQGKGRTWEKKVKMENGKRDKWKSDMGTRIWNDGFGISGNGKKENGGEMKKEKTMGRW